MRGPSRPVCAGFTLVEVLVAIAILAVLTLMAWQAVNGLAQTERLVRQRSDDWVALQSGLGQWVADLDAMEDNPVLPAFEFNGLTVRLIRRAADESRVQSTGLQVVAWTVQQGHWQRWVQGGLTTPTALRQAWEVAGQWGQGMMGDDARRRVSVVPASGWLLYVHRDGTWTNPLSAPGASSGRPEAPAGSNAPIPVPDGVRLQLTLTAPHPVSGPVVLDWARPTRGGGKS